MDRFHHCADEQKRDVAKEVLRSSVQDLRTTDHF